MSTSYGYGRVSTKDQNEARQLIALRSFGIAEECIFIDKQSGKDFNRPQYIRLLRKMKEGDTLVIKSTLLYRSLFQHSCDQHGSCP